MVMIPVWKEHEIRQKIIENPSLTNRDLAEIFEVSQSTIREIRQSPGIRPRKPPSPHKQLKINRRCPQCGGMLNIWPCPLCRRWAYWYDIEAEKHYKEDHNAPKKAA